MKTLHNKIILVVLLLSMIYVNQATAQRKSEYKLTLADSMEVISINTMVTAIYDLISGPAGERNWIKLKFMCLPGATFISIKQKEDGSQEFFQGSVDDYIKMIDPILKVNDYYENETERNVQISDNIANVFSSFESTMFDNTIVINQRGTNSIQLLYKNERWWIANIVWKNEPNESQVQPKK